MANDSLYYNGHKYTNEGKCVCPLGDEYSQALIVTEFMGRPAYWDDGYIYVLEGETEVESPRDWVSRLNFRLIK